MIKRNKDWFAMKDWRNLMIHKREGDPLKNKEMEDEQNCERHGDSKWALLALHGLKRDIGANNNWLSSE